MSRAAYQPAVPGPAADHRTPDRTLPARSGAPAVPAVASAPAPPLGRDLRRLSPAQVLLLQRTVGNRATAELLARRGNPAEASAPPSRGAAGGRRRRLQRLVANDDTLYVSAGWLDREAHWGAGRATLRAINTSHPNELIPALTSSLPLPGLAAILEVSPGNVATTIVPEFLTGSADSTRPRQEATFLRYVTRLLEAYTQLLELDGADVQHLPQPRPIMQPLDLLPEPDDLAGLGDAQLRTKWCALIALVKGEGRPAVRAFLNQQYAGGAWLNAAIPASDTAPEMSFYKALHTYYYVAKGVFYDDTSTRVSLLSPWGYRLKLVGPTSFSALWRAGMRTGRRYIVDTKDPDHTVYVTVTADFTQPLAAGQTLGGLFTFHNDGTNYNQPANVTLNAKVLNVFEK